VIWSCLSRSRFLKVKKLYINPTTDMYNQVLVPANKDHFGAHIGIKVE
jgi:hypothetical protein